MARMFSIGEFSKIVGMTVKTLRFYHEQQVLIPAFIDPQSGYRYYTPQQIEIARLISLLRGMDMPLTQIKEILALSGEEQLLNVLEQHKSFLRQRITQLGQSVKALDQFLENERQAQLMSQLTPSVLEKTLESTWIAGIRMKGRYSDCGKAFARLGRAMGRHIAGKPLMLHYDAEYKDEDADFEACMLVQPSVKVDGISVRQLPSGRCVTLVHKGPYDQLGRSYAMVFGYIKDKGYRIIMPTREVYIKGPGMIFKGNPRNYLTEIQIPIENIGGES
jgi:DNA-binding transcriptional MerR regulator